MSLREACQCKHRVSRQGVHSSSTTSRDKVSTQPAPRLETRCPLIQHHVSRQRIKSPEDRPPSPVRQRRRHEWAWRHMFASALSKWRNSRRDGDECRHAVVHWRRVILSKALDAWRSATPQGRMLYRTLQRRVQYLEEENNWISNDRDDVELQLLTALSQTRQELVDQQLKSEDMETAMTRSLSKWCCDIDLVLY